MRRKPKIIDLIVVAIALVSVVLALASLVMIVWNAKYTPIELSILSVISLCVASVIAKTTDKD